MLILLRIALFLLVTGAHANAAVQCGAAGVGVQVLGSGGPEINDRRASSSYLVWVNGRALLLLDTGGGSAYNFERSGAEFGDLKAILYSHFHVDHSADLPVYIKGSFFNRPRTDLPVYGPDANALMPDTDQFVQALFNGQHGAFKYLSDFLAADSGANYRMVPHTLDTGRHEVQSGYQDDAVRTSAIPVHHGSIPALAWKVEVAGRSLVFSGDMNGDYHSLPQLAKGADILVAHNAIPEGMEGVARELHMPPSVIGMSAAKAGVKQLVLSHRMLRTLGREQETEAVIRKYYSGPIMFADDMDCIEL
jgi:ribonuclease BN (tRNA processing enzyme)